MVRGHRQDKRGLKRQRTTINRRTDKRSSIPEELRMIDSEIALRGDSKLEPLYSDLLRTMEYHSTKIGGIEALLCLTEVTAAVMSKAVTDTSDDHLTEEAVADLLANLFNATTVANMEGGYAIKARKVRSKSMR